MRQLSLFDLNKDTTGRVLGYGGCRGVSFLTDEASSTLITSSLLTIRHVMSSFSSHRAVCLGFFHYYNTRNVKSFLKTISLSYNNASLTCLDVTLHPDALPSMHHMHCFINTGPRSTQLRKLKTQSSLAL